MVELKVYEVAWVSLFDNEPMFAQVDATDELNAIAQVEPVAWCTTDVGSIEQAVEQAFGGDVVLSVHEVCAV